MFDLVSDILGLDVIEHRVFVFVLDQDLLDLIVLHRFLYEVLLVEFFGVERKDYL